MLEQPHFPWKALDKHKPLQAEQFPEPANFIIRDLIEDWNMWQEAKEKAKQTNKKDPKISYNSLD